MSVGLLAEMMVALKVRKMVERLAVTRASTTADLMAAVSVGVKAAKSAHSRVETSAVWWVHWTAEMMVHLKVACLADQLAVLMVYLTVHL